jgi:arabinogalactan endo-1,4-beta-galactosidase
VEEHVISRRTLLQAGAAGAGALALGGLAPAQRAVAAGTFHKGADISWAQQMQAHGYVWKDKNGVQRDLLTILKSYGVNAIRLRTWVNPSSDPVAGHCSIGETAAMAAQCQNAGFAVDIDFHFGDTWNSVGVQNPPAAWASLGYGAMLTAMNSYVSGAMKTLKAAGVTPTWVQIGNETNTGICHPVGAIGKPAQMTGLLMAAHDQIKNAFPATQVLVHLAQPQNLAGVENFLNAYRGNGGTWDITGLSSYAQGGNIAGVLGDMSTIQSTYGKPVMQVEYGGPLTKATQVRDGLTQFITGLKGFGGLGAFFWEPEGYPAFGGYAGSAWDPATLRPTVALDGFLND